MSDFKSAAEEFNEAAHELAEAIRELWECSCGAWNRAPVCKRCAETKPEDVAP